MKLRAAAAFDAHGDLVENFDALDGIFSDGGFAAQHDRVRLFKNRVRHVGDFRARRHRRFDHAFEHVRGDDDRTADAQTRFDNAPLHNRQFFIGNFNPQIAARDHDAVGFLDDGFEIGNRLLILDFGDDQRLRFAGFKHFAKLKQVAGFAHERERDEIHFEFEAELHVLDVFGRERGQTDFDAGQIDMTAAAEFAFRENFAFNLVAVFGEHFHLDRAVVNQHDIADADVIDKIFVIHIHRMLFQIALAAHGEREFLAGLQIQRHAQIAGADGRTLRVHHDAGEIFARSGGGATVFDDAAHPLVRRVRHVEAENVDARVHELAD